MYFHCLNEFYHYASLSLNNHGKNLGKFVFFDVGIDEIFRARLSKASASWRADTFAQERSLRWRLGRWHARQSARMWRMPSSFFCFRCSILAEDRAFFRSFGTVRRCSKPPKGSHHIGCYGGAWWWFHGSKNALGIVAVDGRHALG